MYRLLLSLASRLLTTNEGWDLEEQQPSFLAPQRNDKMCSFSEVPQPDGAQLLSDDLSFSTNKGHQHPPFHVPLPHSLSVSWILLPNKPLAVQFLFKVCSRETQIKTF